MKIIASMPNDRVLVSLKQEELANLLGEYSHYDVKREFIDSSIKNETEIVITDIYRKHNLIHSILNQSDYDRARRKLQEIMDALTPIENKITKLSESGVLIPKKKKD